MRSVRLVLGLLCLVGCASPGQSDPAPPAGDAAVLLRPDGYTPSGSTSSQRPIDLPLSATTSDTEGAFQGTGGFWLRQFPDGPRLELRFQGSARQGDIANLAFSMVLTAEQSQRLISGQTLELGTWQTPHPDAFSVDIPVPGDTGADRGVINRPIWNLRMTMRSDRSVGLEIALGPVWRREYSPRASNAPTASVSIQGVVSVDCDVIMQRFPDGGWLSASDSTFSTPFCRDGARSYGIAAVRTFLMGGT